MRIWPFLLVAVVAVSLILVCRVEEFNALLLRSDADSIPSMQSVMARAIGGGARVFAVRCATCHAGGRANTATGVPDLTDGDWLYGSGRVSEIERIVRDGIRASRSNTWNLAVMPAYAQAHPSADTKIQPLSPENIRDLVEYLMHLQGRPADQSALPRGAALYGGAGGCYDCHTPDAKGDPAIGAPDLTDRITLYGDGDRQSLFNSIAYGHAGICPGWRGILSSAQIREVALYVFSLNRAAPPSVSAGK
jgi:cytochrome c oxidase cbb3-type subunit III